MTGAPARMMPRRWILVVDDNRELRDLWLEVLHEAGYAAVGCQDGLEAAELIRDLLPDLILLDLRMPHASGWDFLETVRATPRWQHIPVVIVSGYLDERPDLTAETGLNIIGRLAKPVAVSDLLATVQEAIGPSQR